MNQPLRSPLAVYRDGRFGMREIAWEQLQQWGELEEGTPRWEEAYAVARETMMRARENVERIIVFLQNNSYTFGFSQNGGLLDFPVWTPPTPESAVVLAKLMERFGPLPLSLRAWYEVVGTVSLQGGFLDDCDWGREMPSVPMRDPLMVAPLDFVLADLESLREHGDEAGIVVSPDIYMKANIGGGAPYEIRVPDRRADANLLNLITFLPAPPGAPAPRHLLSVAETFVSYLRRSFQWAGFPGLALGSPADVERLKPLFAQMLPI